MNDLEKNKEINERQEQKFFDAILDGKIDIHTLNMNSQTEKTAWIKAVKERPNDLLSTISVNEPKDEELVSACLKENYKLFLNLKKEQYFDSAVNFYLHKTFVNTIDEFKRENGDSQVWVEKNYSDQTIISFVYNTKDGEQYYYYDKELNIPTTLVSSLSVSFKIVEPKKFLQFMDRGVATITFNSAYNVVLNLFTAYYRNALNQILSEKDTGYYKLHSKFDELEELIKKYIDADTLKTGLGAGSVIIKKIDIPDDTKTLLEDQSFYLRRMDAENNHYLNYVEKSMHAYEMKGEIVKKYPEIAENLTEAEKDLALRRYLIKKGVVSLSAETEIERKKLLSRKETKSMGEVEKQEDVVEIYKKDGGDLKTVRTAIAVIMAIVSLCLFAASAGAGLIGLGITCIVFAIFTFSMANKNGNESIDTEDIREEAFSSNERAEKEDKETKDE